MPVVIEELEVQAQLQPAAPPPASPGDAAAGHDVDERALQAALAREAWRHERLAAD